MPSVLGFKTDKTNPISLDQPSLNFSSLENATLYVDLLSPPVLGYKERSAWRGSCSQPNTQKLQKKVKDGKF